MLKHIILATSLLTSTLTYATDYQFTFKMKNELNIPVSVNYVYGCASNPDMQCNPYQPPSPSLKLDKVSAGGAQYPQGQQVVPANTTVTITKTVPNVTIPHPEDMVYMQDKQIYNNPNFEGGKVFDPLCFAKEGKTMDIYGSYIVTKGQWTLYQIHCTEE